MSCKFSNISSVFNSLHKISCNLTWLIFFFHKRECHWIPTLYQAHCQAVCPSLSLHKHKVSALTVITLKVMRLGLLTQSQTWCFVSSPPIMFSQVACDGSCLTCAMWSPDYSPGWPKRLDEGFAIPAVIFKWPIFNHSHSLSWNCEE